MREIKFRGKAMMSVEELDSMHFQHDNGWFVGNLIVNGKKPYIVGDIVESDPEYIVHEFWVPVHPESVGQFTGLYDKNGVEIYEGDIIEFYDFWDELSGGNIDGKVRVGVVEYLGSGFMVSNRGSYEEDLFLLKINDDELKVIGNIYENPELLEVKE